MSERHSQSLGLDLITDPVEKAKVEAENALRQTKAAMRMLPKWVGENRPLLRPSLFLDLHRILLSRISQYPGTYRPGSMSISHSDHAPPTSSDVPRLIEELCDYVNENWTKKSAIHLSAYVLWRVNWIHPFDDGNGRTARIVSYLVLCAHTKTELPGTPPIPEQISQAKGPYYKALEAADKKWLSGVVDVGFLEELLASCLANQLIEFYKFAGGGASNIDEVTKAEITDAVSAAQAEGIRTREANAALPKIKIEKRNILEKNQGLIAVFSIIVTILLAVFGWYFGK